jgi:hypothetical protein
MSLCLESLPASVRGSRSSNEIDRGHLYLASPPCSQDTKMAATSSRWLSPSTNWVHTHREAVPYLGWFGTPGYNCAVGPEVTQPPSFVAR